MSEVPELRAVQAVLPVLVVPWVLARLEVRLGLADLAVLAFRRHLKEDASPIEPKMLFGETCLLVLVGLEVLAGLVGKACTVVESLNVINKAALWAGPTHSTRFTWLAWLCWWLSWGTGVAGCSWLTWSSWLSWDSTKENWDDQRRVQRVVGYRLRWAWRSWKAAGLAPASTSIRGTSGGWGASNWG